VPKCPHCGEPITKDQERCFACGAKARAGVRRGGQPVNPLVFIFAGAVVLVAIVGIIIVIAGHAKKTKVEVKQQEVARVRDSVRTARLARRDTAKEAARAQVAGALTDEIDKLDQRFNAVRQEVVVKDQPSPEQAKLISQIRYEVVRLRQLAGTVASLPEPQGDSLKAQVRDGERMVRNLISDLSRAPKKK